MRLLALCFLILFGENLSAQQKTPQAYLLYDSKGQEVDWQLLLNSIHPGTLVLFGELHNNAIAHWLQLRLLKDLNSNFPDEVILGMEMFEADDQLKLSEYIKGITDEKNFKSDARFWKNYETDYKPLIEFSKENGIPVVASNVPRRYASLVYKKGFDELKTLSLESKQYMAPVPFPYDSTLPAYQEMLQMMGGHEPNPNFPKAQAIKDATMAHFSVAAMSEKSVLLHLNGAFHSDNRQGIAWYAKNYKSNIPIVTISTISAEDVSKFPPESKKVADFVIVVANDMTSTH